MKTFEDIVALLETTTTEDEMNTIIFGWIQEGLLPLGAFLAYQGSTQGEVWDCLQNQDEDEE